MKFNKQQGIKRNYKARLRKFFEGTTAIGIASGVLGQRREAIEKR